MDFSLQNINSVIKLKNSDYKYLSPFILNTKAGFNLYFCNRKSNKKFYGEINMTRSKDLVKWNENFKTIIRPKKKDIYSSFISPSIINIRDINYLFVEAQKKDAADILCFQSKTLENWEENSEFFLKSENNLYQTPFIIKYKNRINLYYSINRQFIRCAELDENLKIKKSYDCLEANLKNEKFSIYAPNVIKINNLLVMFYSAWKSDMIGNINIAISSDGFTWKKIKQDIINLDKNISIISEPFMIKVKNFYKVYFEYKIQNHWNISYLNISNENFLNLITN